MGYYTDFSLSHNNPEISDKDIADEINVITDYRMFDSSLEATAKWYNWKNDMKRLSKLYPTTVFALCGNGEDDDDIWKAYFKNGKMQLERTIIAFNPFDESKLS